MAAALQGSSREQRDVDTTFPIVGVYDRFPEPYLPMLRKTVPDSNLHLCTRWDRLDQIVDEIDVLLAFKLSGKPFPRETILSAPSIKWVQLASAGIDHITPFDQSKLVVTNASGIHGDIMSQYVVGALVYMLWDFPRLADQQRSRQWEPFTVPSLARRTMGIIGAGNVGSTIGRRAKAFGMRVIGTRRSGRPVKGFDRVYGPEGMLTVLAESDVVVLSLPLTSETKKLIGRSELNHMRPTAYLVNVSRGGIVDEAALLDLLENRSIAGAILDVFEQEPLPPENPFWSLPNVLVTPHTSSESENWAVAIVRLFRDNLRRWINHEPLRNVVDPTLGY